MHPGGACIACHAKQGGGGDDEAPRFTIGGTVYPTAHEPDDCNGTSMSSAGTLSVLITEANGKAHSLAVNTVGNFSYTGSIATPYTAQVVAGSAVRAMAHAQTSGDCNGCHTVNGSSTTTGAASAPGRIMAP
jgi:cytochrome c553